MGRIRLILLTSLGLAAAAYCLVAGIIYLKQEQLLFPAYLVAPARALPADAERLTVTAPDGTRLEGVFIPAARPSPGETLLLVFAGNASNAQGVAELVHEIHPDHDVAAFFYRGYAPSGGVASARDLMADAPLVHDLVKDRFQPRRIVAVGVSLGSGIAASLAERRQLGGLILITPFDSLAATARQLHPWLPVTLLLRHDMDSAGMLSGSDVPVAIIAAGNDRLVRPERTQALRASTRNLVFETTLTGAQHNDIFLHTDFSAAMRDSLARIESAG